MATNLMVQADSALSRDVKISSLAEEVTRRLRNTSLEVDITRRLAILEEGCVRMKTSGHKESYQRGSIKRNPELPTEGEPPQSHKQYQPLFKIKALKRGIDLWIVRSVRGTMAREPRLARARGKPSRRMEGFPPLQ